FRPGCASAAPGPGARPAAAPRPPGSDPRPPARAGAAWPVAARAWPSSLAGWRARNSRSRAGRRWRAGWRRVRAGPPRGHGQQARPAGRACRDTVSPGWRPVRYRRSRCWHSLRRAPERRRPIAAPQAGCRARPVAEQRRRRWPRPRAAPRAVAGWRARPRQPVPAAAQALVPRAPPPGPEPRARRLSLLPPALEALPQAVEVGGAERLLQPGRPGLAEAADTQMPAVGTGEGLDVAPGEVAGVAAFGGNEINARCGEPQVPVLTVGISRELDPGGGLGVGHGVEHGTR